MPKSYAHGTENTLIEKSSDGSEFRIVIPLKVIRYVWHFKVVGLAKVVFQKYEKQQYYSGSWESVQWNRTFLPEIVRLAAKGFMMQIVEIVTEVGSESGHPRSLAA
jgi:hypothetical protein